MNQPVRDKLGVQNASFGGTPLSTKVATAHTENGHKQVTLDGSAV